MFGAWVHEDAVAAQSVIQVRAGGRAGCPDAADHLPLRNAPAGADAWSERGEVQVIALVPTRVPNANLLPAAARPAGRHDNTARHGDDWRAGRRAVVDTEVRPEGAVHRVEPSPGEAGGHAHLELQRALEEEPLERPSILVVVVGLPGRGIGPAERLVFLAVGNKARREDCAVAGELSLARGLLEHRFEIVSGLQVRIEVDGAAEDVRQRQCELDCLAGRRDRGDQRGMRSVDRGTHRLDRRFLFDREDTRFQLRGAIKVGIDDAKQTVRVDLVVELAQGAVNRANQPIGAIGAEVARIENVPRGRHRCPHEVGGEIVRAQQAVERGITRNARVDRLDLAVQDDVRERTTHARLIGTAAHHSR